jgi:signal transduction histidine kinase
LQVHFSGTHLFESVGVTLFFAFLYSWARNRFNFATNRFFFRGYYEPQEVLNKLSDSLVHSIDVAYLKLNSAKILQDALKTKHFNYWSSGDPKDSEYIDLLNKLYGSRRKDDVLSLDDYEGDSSTAKELSKRNVALAVRLRTTRNEELGYITLGFKESGDLYTEKDKRLLEIAADEIAISLQNALHFEEIKHFNLTLQERINIATKQLRASNVKLKALDETKDDFISMASHQLRTPLTSVKGYLSMVLDGDAGTVTPTQRKMLSQAFISSQRMVYMIADLLNVSRLKTGKFIIEFSPINLADIVQEEVNQLVETAQSREVALDYVKPSNFPITMLDETKIRQVIMNFMDNAIYYTPAGGNIKISLNDEHGSISFRVTDSGIGVPRDEQHHLFTKFYRASNAQKARPDGTGLGLFMAKKVVATQGGSILFESQEGKGSTFGFIFSKAKLQEQADQQSADKAKIPLLAK